MTYRFILQNIIMLIYLLEASGLIPVGQVPLVAFIPRPIDFGQYFRCEVWKCLFVLWAMICSNCHSIMDIFSHGSIQMPSNWLTILTMEWAQGQNELLGSNHVLDPIVLIDLHVCFLLKLSWVILTHANLQAAYAEHPPTMHLNW